MALTLHFTLRPHIYTHLSKVRENGRPAQFTLALAMFLVLVLGLCLGLHYNFTKPQLWFENLERCKCAEFPRENGLMVTNGVVFEGEQATELGWFLFIMTAYLGIVFMNNKLFLETTFLQHSSLSFKLVYLISLFLTCAPFCLPNILENGWSFWPRFFFY